ncbi:MAG: SDR family NAD(P)-dependent oxidoreductase [Anaerolineales bacterium]|nr:SDR family NAD(P)-dependent oxidoreductase [Anaerolineales bacterium]
MILEGKVAVVTGASRGIGRAVAKTFAREGAQVAVASRSASELEALVDEITSAVGMAFAHATDVTNSEQVDSLFQRTVEIYGPVDILVNNAGTQICGALHEFDEDDFDTILSVNLKGVFLCTKAVLPSMIDRRGGLIINIASVSGLRGWAEDSPYTASKWAVLGLSECLDEEVRQFGIRVCDICPGSVDTDLIEPWVGSDDPKRPLILKAEDIANAALYVASQPPNVSVDRIVIRPVVETMYSDYLSDEQVVSIREHITPGRTS